jgi:excisionase family DNA binding protein
MHPKRGDDTGNGDLDSPWMGRSSQSEMAISKALGHPPFTPDMGFVAFLRAVSQFGFFRFGPITIDVDVVEDILMRTHPRGAGGEELPEPSADYLRFHDWGWRLVSQRGAPRLDERLALLMYMQWGEGLPARVFGELGVSAEDVEAYIRELSAGKDPARLGPRKLYTTEEAAQYLGVHVQTIRAWIRSGKLPAARLAGQKSIRIREADLDLILEPIDPRSFKEEEASDGPVHP